MGKRTSRGVIAAGHQLTANAGADILRNGGTAIDAGIAALAMSCVSEPVLSSPGGGGFAMLKDGGSEAVSLIDFFAQTPIERRQPGQTGSREIHADFGTATQAFHIGHATSATPGFFSGIENLHRRGAVMPLPELFAPAVKAARDGITITPYQHYLSTVVHPILTATGPAARLFAPAGALPPAGGTFRNPGLADALEIISHDGFSSSPVGQSVAETQAQSGNLTCQDLAAYHAIERAPLSIRVGPATVHLNPLPAASGTLIAYSLANLEEPGTIGIARALDEADRARKACGSDLAGLLTAPIRQRGTTHISTIDASGNACAITVSNGEGNGELVGGFGFMLNNILGEEDVNPHLTGDWPVDTRLSSMMCPSLIETDDGGIIALGSGGSNRIRSAISQVIAQHCLLDKNLEDAVAAPRLHVEGGHLDFEDMFEPAERQMLSEAFPDHRAWPEHNMFFGGVHAAELDREGNPSGAGDRRRDGVVVLVS